MSIETQETIKVKKPFCRRLYRYIFTFAMAIISTYLVAIAGIMSVLGVLFFFSIAYIYSTYSELSCNKEYSIGKKIGVAITGFFITGLIFMVFERGASSLLGIENAPPTCLSIEAKQLLNDRLKDNKDISLNSYTVKDTQQLKFDKENNVYYCSSELVSSSTKENDTKFINFKIQNSEEKGYFNITIEN